jgi:hypothetical protein
MYYFLKFYRSHPKIGQKMEYYNDNVTESFIKSGNGSRNNKKNSLIDANSLDMVEKEEVFYLIVKRNDYKNETFCDSISLKQKIGDR